MSAVQPLSDGFACIFFPLSFPYMALNLVCILSYGVCIYINCMMVPIGMFSVLSCQEKTSVHGVAVKFPI